MNVKHVLSSKHVSKSTNQGSSNAVKACAARIERQQHLEMPWQEGPWKRTDGFSVAQHKGSEGKGLWKRQQQWDWSCTAALPDPGRFGWDSGHEHPSRGSLCSAGACICFCTDAHLPLVLLTAFPRLLI